MENIEPEQDLLLDSEPMPPQAFLLHPSSVNEMERERESLFVTALSLAGRMTATLFSSPILEDDLKDAIRFLKSDEQPPAQKLHEKLGLLNRILATITAAVDAHEGQRLRYFTLPLRYSTRASV
jgi:hypothetical protein